MTDFNPTLDWAPQFDERSRHYAAVAGDKPLRSYTWSCPVTLNQGAEGACVGFGYSHLIAGNPRKRPGVTEAFARQLYKEAQRNDYMPGENYSGTSVLAGAKAAKAAGYITEYRWAFNTNDALWAIGYKGPLVIGVDWHQGMKTPDSKGMIRKTGPVIGGHAISVIGVSVPKKLVKVHNSWGSRWGIKGQAFLTFDDFDALLQNRGEACIPVKAMPPRR